MNNLCYSPFVFRVTFLIALFALGCHRAAPEGNTPTAMATHIIDAAPHAFETEDWTDLENRLGALYNNQDKEADEAVVILMSFYVGEHNGEELYENLISRGPRMIPLLERYLHEEPVSLIAQSPARVRLERATTTGFLQEALRTLRFQAGARHISAVTSETSPLREQSGKCAVKILKRPELKFPDNIVHSGEAYNGAPVLRVTIEENGDTTNIQLLQPSGIRKLDAILVSNVRQWKYAPRPGCGTIEANVVFNIDWLAADSAATSRP
jgi:TonB family protein